MKRKRNKIAATVSALVLASIVVTIFLFSFVSVFSDKNVNSAYDEMLFSLGKGGSITEYYYNGGGDEDYIPKLFLYITVNR